MFQFIRWAYYIVPGMFKQVLGYWYPYKQVPDDIVLYTWYLCRHDHSEDSEILKSELKQEWQLRKLKRKQFKVLVC